MIRSILRILGDCVKGLQGAESLFEILYVVPNKAFVCETIIRVVPYNHMVEHLDHQESGRPYQISGQFSVFVRRGGISRWVIMDENQGGR